MVSGVVLRRNQKEFFYQSHVAIIELFSHTHRIPSPVPRFATI